MIEEICRKLMAEVEVLNHELHVVLPDTLEKAIAHGDLRENADYQAAIERQGFIGARLEHLRSRLFQLSEIDLSKVPKDRVGLGSRVTVVDLDTKVEEIFEVVIPDAVEVDNGQISVASPLGRALLDKKRERRNQSSTACGASQAAHHESGDAAREGGKRWRPQETRQEGGTLTVAIEAYQGLALSGLTARNQRVRDGRPGWEMSIWTTLEVDSFCMSDGCYLS